MLMRQKCKQGFAGFCDHFFTEDVFTEYTNERKQIH